MLMYFALRKSQFICMSRSEVRHAQKEGGGAPNMEGRADATTP